ncbi:hypothetical protein CGCSCA1_v011046 [Colletotrichum siamense]|uniref:uncharacterized protein n=1 Tax=Colletotrichum siamense TaxID=690259 RepID=UPI00187291F2|nr:uncharacterized protein CGCS363_v002473 [Colletotrichum siamense]KAF4869740.1 hypothetical protein CGCSCA1_v011046 [Colletotrichum siamense]KAF5510966.1 hypothetical protein CGCS363_v002473 [Colletotrichum siamense]
MKFSIVPISLSFLLFGAVALGQGSVGGLCAKDSDCLACLNDGTGRRLFCPGSGNGERRCAINEKAGRCGPQE